MLKFHDCYAHSIRMSCPALTHHMVLQCKQVRFDCCRVLVLDNAAIHHTYEELIRICLEAVNKHAKLEFLPPYSPELNPVRNCGRLRIVRCATFHGLQENNLGTITLAQIVVTTVNSHFVFHSCRQSCSLRS